MLSDEQLEHYKQALLQREADIDLQFEQTEEMSQPVEPDPAIGRLTRQDAMQQQQMVLENRRRLKLQRTQLKTAMERVEKGSFGVCVLCKNDIAVKRLDIIPESPLCVACLESRGKGRSSPPG